MADGPGQRGATLCVVCWTLLETRLDYGYYVFSGLSFPIVLSLTGLLSSCSLSDFTPSCFEPGCVVSVRFETHDGLRDGQLGRCVAHRFPAGSRIREAFRCGRSTCVPCCLSSCTSTAFSSWTTMLSSLSLSCEVRFCPGRHGFRGYISQAVHPQVVHTSRFNMDDCEEPIPLWFCREVVDSEVTSSEHFSGCSSSGCTHVAFQHG